MNKLRIIQIYSNGEVYYKCYEPDKKGIPGCSFTPYGAYCDYFKPIRINSSALKIGAVS